MLEEAMKAIDEAMEAGCLNEYVAGLLTQIQELSAIAEVCRNCGCQEIDREASK